MKEEILSVKTQTGRIVDVVFIDETLAGVDNDWIKNYCLWIVDNFTEDPEIISVNEDYSKIQFHDYVVTIKVEERKDVKQ